MSQIQILVIFTGIVFTVSIAWYFWSAPQAQTRAIFRESGVQEVAGTVKGGNGPDLIAVQFSHPARLTVTRQESSACSGQVLFPDLNQNALLPGGQKVTLECTPEKPGEYRF